MMIRRVVVSILLSLVNDAGYLKRFSAATEADAPLGGLVMAATRSPRVETTTETKKRAPAEADALSVSL
jgi:hypothetical protein